MRVWQKQQYIKIQRQSHKIAKKAISTNWFWKLVILTNLAFPLNTKWNHVRFTYMRRNVLSIFILIFTTHATTSDISKCLFSWKVYVFTAKTAVDWYHWFFFWTLEHIHKFNPMFLLLTLNLYYMFIGRNYPAGI